MMPASSEWVEETSFREGPFEVVVRYDPPADWHEAGPQDFTILDIEIRWLDRIEPMGSLAQLDRMQQLGMVKVDIKADGSFEINPSERLYDRLWATLNEDRDARLQPPDPPEAHPDTMTWAERHGAQVARSLQGGSL